MELPNAKSLARSKHHHSQTKDKNRYKKKAHTAGFQKAKQIEAAERQANDVDEEGVVEGEEHTAKPRSSRRKLPSNASRYDEDQEEVEQGVEEWRDMKKLLEGINHCLFCNIVLYHSYFLLLQLLWTLQTVLN